MPTAVPERAVDARVTALMVLLCASWGLQQVAIKVALVELTPFTQSAARGAIAALAILAWCAVRGRMPRITRRSLPAGLLLGVNFGVEFFLIYWGISYTEASRAALFLYTTPFFVVAIGWFLLPQERLGPVQTVGLLLAFAGVALALGQHSGAEPPTALLGDAMVLAGAALWAVNTLLVKLTPLADEPAETIVLYQLVIGSVMAAVAAFAVGEHNGVPSTQTILILLYQAVWVATVTYLIWFSLVAHYSANLLSAYTFLTPLFGVAAGHYLLGDPISGGFAVSCVLVLVGLVVVNRPSPQGRKGGRELTENPPSGRA